MVPTIRARLRSLWRGLRRRSAVESEMSEEFSTHIDMRAADLVNNGSSHEDAVKQARREFGSTERYKEEGRASRALHRIDALRFSWLDVKLGARMMARYPALTIIGGLGMALGVAIAAGYTAATQAMLNPELPLPGGERIVSLQNWDVRENDSDGRALHDFITWRAQLKSVQDVSAYRTVTRNVITADGITEPLPMAEMSAAGFRVAGSKPQLGRYLLDSDEQPGALPVAVIGYDLWQRRFAGDAGIVGRHVRLGTQVHTIVGVMPEGFAFPINHNLWIPFRFDPSQYQRGAGPYITVFGRLAQGSALKEADAELRGIGQRTAAAFPRTHEHLRARVLWFTWDVAGLDAPGVLLLARTIPFLAALVLLLVCANVAILVYARTVLRRSEIVVRTALGASRWRVIAQLFGESLVLASLATAVGLALAAFAFRVADTQMPRDRPMWIEFRISFSVVVYAAVLAVLAAAITGVVPALKVTGRRLQRSLQHLTGGGSGIMLGRSWTFLILAQVAVAAAVMPTALFMASEFMQDGKGDPGFPTNEYLSAGVYMERDADREWLPSQAAAVRNADFNDRYEQRVSELMRRLRNEPGVDQVTFASTVPGNEQPVLIDVEGVARPAGYNAAQHSGPEGHTVRLGRVDVGFLSAFNVPILAGRNFALVDADSGATAVIVNQSFARRFFGEMNAIGRRVRYLERSEDATLRWYRIVGVVPDFPGVVMGPEEEVLAVMYDPASPAPLYPVQLAVHTRADNTARLAGRLNEITAAVDPTLQPRNLSTIEAVFERDSAGMRLIGIAIAIVVASVLLLSAAGIYAMMSVAVLRRRREIGIRAALGASPRVILASIFARSTGLLGTGIVLGLIAGVYLNRMLADGARNPIVIPIVSAIIVAVGLIASIGPARKGLRIQPTEVLKEG